MIQRRLFHSAVVLAIALFAAAMFALAITLVFDGDLRWFLLYYFVPIAVPFVAFLFDRVERWQGLPRRIGWIDLPILILALLRSIFPIPLISGHALFLTYALFTTRSAVARITAAIVLLQVIVIKIFYWQDATVFGGIILGLGGWRVWVRFCQRQEKLFENPTAPIGAKN